MKGLVYMIRSKSSELVYYGSTLQKMLSNRMASHRTSYKRWLAGKCNGCTSFQILVLGDAYIELVEEVEVETKQHLRALEGKYQRENECVNKNIAGRTKAEWASLPENKAANAAYAATPERKAAKAAYNATPERKSAQAAYNAAYHAKPEHKAALAAKNATPERKAALAAYSATPERKAALAANSAKPEHKAARAAYRAKPEHKAAQAAKNAAAYQKRKALLN
jgi:hypothetical protein